MINLISILILLFPAVLPAVEIPGVQLIDFNFKKYQGHFTGNFMQKDRQIKGASYLGRSSRSAFTEELELTMDGSLYHRELFTYFLNTNLGLNQNNISRAGKDGYDSNDRGFFRDLMFQGFLLPRKPVNLILGFQRKFRQLNNDFFEDSNTNSQRWNIQGNWRNRYFPVNAGISDSQREEFYGDRQIVVNEQRLEIGTKWGTRDKANGNIKFNRTDLHRKETSFYNIKQQNSLLQSSFTYPFDAIGDRVIQSLLFANQIAGFDSITSVTWSSSARMKIYDNLVSLTRYSFQYYQNKSILSRSHHISTELNHQLYSSLLSHIQTDLRFYREEGFSKDEYKLMLAWDYKKWLPLGRLVANLGFDANWDNISSEKGMIRRGELTHTFSNDLSLLIPQEGVMSESISITSSDGLIIYSAEKDYQINPYGNTFEIQRTPGSSIPDSADIKISYLFEGNPTSNTYYTIWNYGLAYQLQGYWDLTVGYKGYSALYPEAGDDTWSTQDRKKVHNWYLRVDYHPVSVELIREISTSRITPYRTTDLSFNVILGSYINQYLMTRAQAGWQYLPMRKDRQEYGNISIEYFRRISRSLSGQIAWGYRRIHGKLNDIKEQKWRSALKYTNPKFSLSLEYEFLTYIFFQEKETDRRCIVRIDLNS